MNFTDAEGVTHSVNVNAESVFEAAGAAIAALRRDGWIEGLAAASRLSVEVYDAVVVKAPAVRHEVTVRQIEAWLEGVTPSPKERLRKERLRTLLKG